MKLGQQWRDMFYNEKTAATTLMKSRKRICKWYEFDDDGKGRVFGLNISQHSCWANKTK